MSTLGSSLTLSTVAESLRVSLVQSDLHWHQPELNRQMFTEKLAVLKGQTDLIILPEMFTTGFTMQPESVAEPENGVTLDWMLAQAKSLNAALCGSVVVKSNQGFHNRFYWVQPDGLHHSYDKRHLFRMAGEHQFYCAGESALVIEYMGWRIFPQICYDLRFPVWSRNHGQYDLAIYVANWPEVRRHPWQVLLQARAIENLCYVAGVNRVGTDANQLPYSGDSALIDFKGHSQISADAGIEFIQTAALSKSALSDFRTAFPAFSDADNFTLDKVKPAQK
ncbi:Carbon-nitrogen hydrolase [Oceanospirillum multiglobuliferum]|uniref:Omega-amidase YafV n=1 Tax=Oceanospirillum multiglobuliferum TaxID=64969 RepID=A0A1T4PYX1_9GAMM|nr:amidohydrolase [Oceanospirillum multiglobuliferum]OPX55431.1 amidohydrolase [Oceanospirillum multiglobuliferum]SJZ96536.1 Carbon-nitrogen hydrolase [Oceanospirillum multiglobuliferum]